MKLKTVTLGCKVNQYETEYLREGLLGIGYQDAADGQPADLCIVNTCTVTAEGDRKSRQIIRRLARENPASKIVVMGCYATRAPAEVARLPNVTEVLTDKRELPDLLGRFGVTDVPTGISGFGRRHRAYVKVQDGCMLRCSFCIIPHVRPELTSRPLTHILDEVRRLTDNGYREVVLTGIHLGHYGVDRNRNLPKARWTRLSHLVQAIVELPGDFRVRLSSIEATEVTRELIGVMADYGEKICPHLHISMQSGSDSVLRRMRRRWGSRRFVDRCQLFAERLDQPAITTDIIVGFPTETDGEFEETVEAMERVRYDAAFIFKYSERPQTIASRKFPDDVPDAVKSARTVRLNDIQQAHTLERNRAHIGQTHEVLIDEERTKKSDDDYQGRNDGNKIVIFPKGAYRRGQFVQVRITDATPSVLRGEVVERLTLRRGAPAA